MRSIFLFLSLSFAGLLHAESILVNLRDAHMKIKPTAMEFSETAENEHFKVFNGAEEAPLDFTSSRISDADKMRAATTLYHLQKARAYFSEVLGSDYVKEFPVMNVRINMTKPFNEFFHFIKESKKDEFNNAVTIPASTKKAMAGVNPWDMEIWFRPAKPIAINNMVYQTGKEMDDMNVGKFAAQNLLESSIQQSVSDASILGTLDTFDYMGIITRIGYTYGIFELVPKFLMWSTESIKSEAFLDSSMIPEVIYHEFAHAALSDHVSIRRSTPLNEGIANYFAAVILGSDKIADHNGDHSKNISPYKGKSKQKYSSLLETSKASHANFVYSFLWTLRERLGKEDENGKELGDKLIFAMRKHVKYSDKPIKDDLVTALVDAVEEVYPSADARKIRMLIKDHAVKAGI
jgi:hypothetical protein